MESVIYTCPPVAWTLKILHTISEHKAIFGQQGTFRIISRSEMEPSIELCDSSMKRKVIVYYRLREEKGDI